MHTLSHTHQSLITAQLLLLLLAGRFSGKDMPFTFT
jgi:hypothetical protein